MKKKFTIILTLFVMMCTQICANALNYVPPYEEVDGGRAAQNMPEIFSVETAPKYEVASMDFSSLESLNNLTWTGTTRYLSEADGAIVIEKTNPEVAINVALNFAPEEGIAQGVTYAFSCRIKTVDVEGGAPRNLIAAYSDSGWLNETHGYDGYKDRTGDNDWYEMVQTLKIPEGTTNLRLSAYLQKGMTGTVYFDDFKLYRIGVDPMESVLLAPNYKGLIYGDGYGDIDLDVLITEQLGFYHLDEMKLCVRLMDSDDNVIYISEKEKPDEHMNFVFSSAGLAEGDYYLQSILTDIETGDVISKKEKTIRKRTEDFRPDTYVDENGHIIRNGEKTFLKRIYDYNSSYQEIAEKAVEANLDSISHYGMWWNSSTPTILSALQYMRENNIKSHLCLSSYWFSDLSGNMGTTIIKEQTDILKFLTHLANDYKNDEILEGYYIFDEPDPMTEGEEIRWNNEILAQTDVNHPTFGVADKGYGQYGIYTKMTDILGIDPYPIRGKETDDIATAGRNMREIKQNFPNRPVYYVLQGFHYADRGDLRSPTYEEFKNMAWQAICEGAEGLDCYAYPNMKTDTTKDFDTWWSEFTSVYNEVESYENIILSDEPAPLYSVSNGGDWLNIMLKRYNGTTYIFAVNNTKEAKHATVEVDGASSYGLAFEPLEVKILEVSQSHYLSPQAELKTIGFSNGTEIFPVAEGEENLLYVPSDSGVINYTAKVSDNAKIYIGSREVPENGKITVRNLDSFTVTVVAQNGVTKSSKTYKVIKK